MIIENLIFIFVKKEKTKNKIKNKLGQLKHTHKDCHFRWKKNPSRRKAKIKN